MNVASCTKVKSGYQLWSVGSRLLTFIYDTLSDIYLIKQARTYIGYLSATYLIIKISYLSVTYLMVSDTMGYNISVIYRLPI